MIRAVHHQLSAELRGLQSSRQAHSFSAPNSTQWKKSNRLLQGIQSSNCHNNHSSNRHYSNNSKNFSRSFASQPTQRLTQTAHQQLNRPPLTASTSHLAKIETKPSLSKTATQSTHENFRSFLQSNGAIGAGILSGLGLMLGYGCWLMDEHDISTFSELKDHLIGDTDDYDDEPTKYHLNYQLSNQLFDELAFDEEQPSQFNGDRKALEAFLATETPQYDRARAALTPHDEIAAPTPQSFGLLTATQGAHPRKVNAFNPFSARSSTIPSSLASPLSSTKPSTVSTKPSTLSVLSAPQPLPQSLPSSLMPSVGFNPAIDYTSLATNFTQQHQAYTQACQRVDKLNFENRLNDTITAFQHNCFLKAIPWEEAMPIAKEQISQSLLKTDPYAKAQPMLANAALHARLKQVDYSVHAAGARFKAHEQSDHPLAQHTQIRAASGKVYALLDNLNPEDSQALLEQFGMKAEGPFILGEGAFGTVYLAQDLETGDIVAVKDMFSRHMANAEIAEFDNIPTDDHLVSLYDHAHVRTSDGENVSYLFMELVGDVNGDALVKALAIRRQQGFLGGAHKLLCQAILECSVAVVKLHEIGTFHCDIKPENFFISHKAIHLGDYGLSTKDRTQQRGSTLDYNPKDSVYDAEKHDAYALGNTFFEFMHGKRPADMGEPVKTKNTDQLAGNTLAECVDKLRDEDPEKRVTVREFVQLPYIQQLMNHEQQAAVRELILVSNRQDAGRSNPRNPH